MRLLFLDVDGVLNAHDFDHAAMCGPIHRDKVARLNRVLLTADARVVLSSAWRYISLRGEATLTGLDWLFRSHGLLCGRLIGHTPPDTLVRGVFDGTPGSWPVENERGKQIADWLAGDGRRVGAARYAVVDDLDLGITAAGHPFVQTDGSVGLTDADADALVSILVGPR